MVMWENMEKNEKKKRIQQLLTEQLSGKRLILGGCSGMLRDQFVQTLVQLLEQSGADIELHNNIKKAQPEDYVLLFGETTEKAEYSCEELLALGEELQQLAQLRPAGAVFLSDYAVYGACFGAHTVRKEEELGYLSHTSAKDGSAQKLRTAEHFVCRLAREEGVRINTVRACSPADEENAQELVGATLLVMLEGKAGEIYNLPVKGTAEESEPKLHSPLSPMQVVPDTEKLERHLFT